MNRNPAAERRKNVATAEGRGASLGNRVSRGAAKDSSAAPGSFTRDIRTTAFSRGYTLSPLRGCSNIVPGRAEELRFYLRGWRSQ